MGKSLRVRPPQRSGHKFVRTVASLLPLSNWYTNSSSRDGYASYCKACLKRRGRRSHIKRNYGITLEELAAKIESQNGLCVICRTRSAVHVDHDHETGKVRGVLCFECNNALGLFKEDVDVLERAMRYLEEAECQQTTESMALSRLSSLSQEPPPSPSFSVWRLLTFSPDDELFQAS